VPVFATVAIYLSVMLGSGPAPVEKTSIAEAASVPDTARDLAKRGLVMDVTAEAEIEVEIAADQERFELPFGPSPAILIRLPAYKSPYTLMISSYPSNGFHKNVFVPIAVFFDEDFKPKRELEEAAFKWKSMTFGRQHFESTVSIDDAQRDERYVLIFTNGSRTREIVRSGVARTVMPSVTVSIPNTFARSFWGDVRLEVRPKK
jgi:hypothetical protein